MVRIHPDPPRRQRRRGRARRVLRRCGQGAGGAAAGVGHHHGAVAQLGERLLCKQEAVGSIPSSSTRLGVRSGVHGQGPGKSYRLRTTAFKRGDWGKWQSPGLKAVLFFNNSGR